MPRQGIKPVKSNATGAHGDPCPDNIINSALANARMPLIHTGRPTLDDTTHHRRWGTIGRALHPDINRDRATWIGQGSVIIRVGGWFNNLNSQKLRRVAGPYILYPVPNGRDDHCPGLRPGDPPCSHPCPHTLFQPVPPQPAPLPGIYLNTVTGAKGVYLTAGDTSAKPSPSIRCTTWPWDQNCPTPTNHGTRWRDAAHATRGPRTRMPRARTRHCYTSPRNTRPNSRPPWREKSTLSWKA